MEWLSLSLVFVFGAIIGSFLNVVIYRMPRGESVVFPASHCPSCDAPLKAYHNIPILSWLALRGRCAFCSAPISAQYPIIELLSGGIALTAFIKLGITVHAAIVAATFLTLLALVVIDLYEKVAFDDLNITALTLAIFAVPMFTLPQVMGNLMDALIVAGGFTLLRFYVSYYLYWKIKLLTPNRNRVPWLKRYNPIPTYVEAMGEGDIFIGATMGALLGAKLALVAVFLSALLAMPAMLMMHRTDDEENKRLPFIPFLALATWICFVFDTAIITFIYA